MPVESVPARSPRIGRLSRGPLAVATLAAAGLAHAQTAGIPAPTVPASLSGSETQQVWQKLDPAAIAIGVLGLLFVLLLIVRVVQMVRRERPAPRKAAVQKPGRRPADSGLELPSITGNTDWGYDQNKRSAATRSPTVVGRPLDVEAKPTPASQWTRSDVHNAAQASLQPGDSLGKPTNLPPSPYRTSHNPYFSGEFTNTNVAMEVEEVADVLLQAELLVQLGDPKQAMLLLSQHIRDTEQPGPAVWLMLLNLYQTTGRRAQYDALARGFVTLFNAAVPPWVNSGEAGARELESYPQVMMRLQAGWPKPEMRPFLEQLLNDDRGGSRQGFSLTAYREILFLIEVFGVLEGMTRDDEERERIQQKLGTPG